MNPKKRQLPWTEQGVRDAQQMYGLPHLKSKQQVAKHEQKLVSKKSIEQDHTLTCPGCGDWKVGHKPHDEQGMLF